MAFLYGGILVLGGVTKLLYNLYQTDETHMPAEKLPQEMHRYNRSICNEIKTFDVKSLKHINPIPKRKISSELENKLKNKFKNVL